VPFSPYRVRLVRPEDQEALQACHTQVLEVKYPEDFYFKATHGCEGIVGWVAEEENTGEIVGFITVQVQNAADARKMEGDLVALDNSNPFELRFWSDGESKFVYILTMGVLVSHRKAGIATALLGETKKYGERLHGCHSCYLHALSTNKGAIEFYRKNAFRVERLKKSFYVINVDGCDETHDGLLLSHSYADDYSEDGDASASLPIGHCLLPSTFWNFLQSFGGKMHFKWWGLGLDTIANHHHHHKVKS